MVRGGGTRGGVAQLAILVPDEGDQLWKCGGRHLGIGDEREMRRGDKPDWREIFHRVVGEGLVNARAHGERRHRREQDGVAVGQSARGRLRRHDRPRARAIVDNDRPRELLLQFLRQHAGEYVGAAAGGKRTEKGHRALRVIAGGRLPARRRDSGDTRPQRHSEHESSFHAFGTALDKHRCANTPRGWYRREGR